MQLKLAQNSRRTTLGSKKSLFKGQGLKFKDHQIYSFGDDIRFIDWKVTAKTRIPYVKVFEEEKNQGIDVFIDGSRSMAYGYNKCSKFEVAIQVLCLLYLWSDLTKDKIRGIILCDDLIDLPKISGKTGIGHLLQILLKKKILDENGNFILYNSLPINDDKKIERNIQFLMKAREKKNHLVVVSDFYNFINDRCLDHISQNKGGLNLIQILSPIDISTKIEHPISGYFSNDSSMKRRNLFGYINSNKLSNDNHSNCTYNCNNLYQMNIGEKYYLEKFTQRIK